MKIALGSLQARHPAAAPGTAPVLRVEQLHVQAGELLAVIGPSGAGKTTLLQVLACALPPSAGTLRLDGVDPWAARPAELQALRRALFLAPQVPPLPPRQRVVTAVLAGRLPHESLWASLRSLFYPQDIPLAHRALAAFDLGDKLFERVDRISGGERQRVGLARLLVAQARLWLVDEPLSALDPTRARQALHTLTRMAQERGATLVATLHQVDMALAYFPRIVGLRDGAVAFDLPAAEVTPALLHALYAQHLDELSTAAPASWMDAPAAAPAPVVMHCR
ncbi:MAG: ATP-binding cassette domain-containing protein [Burkholderiales bacterium]|nr:ATP-binding cassette domain-containing protein [Burkholderiales bacterium]